ncbi:BatD family protein [sulfur-oxidizing endosymbiont of Gigantopelta aegis]|uniref:BatD family protein n=1 Tax=sulfur-oxidizing endosymbiont of Gigantopelta aegis TaxID=2794934 RepID=UPI0018DE1534|nr:BatD family protein [sulfur-oxidizing endosymbiont of Gigantopelta aegis]
MVKFFFNLSLLLLLLSMISPCYSASNSNFKIIPSKTTIEMGKFLSVKLVYTGDELPGKANLQGWYREFFVNHQSIDDENLTNGLLKQTEIVHLYPRRSGNLVLHALALGGAIARPISIKVTDAIRKGINGTPIWQGVPDKPIWQGETIQISIVQKLLQTSNQVTVEKVNFPSFVVKSLAQEKTPDEVKIRWLLTAQKSGFISLEPPKIIQRGRGRWRFHLPYITINVKPLPSYIPPTVPVGHLSLSAYLDDKNNRPFWLVEIKNSSLLMEEVYGIRTQIAKKMGVLLADIQLSK